MVLAPWDMDGAITSSEFRQAPKPRETDGGRGSADGIGPHCKFDYDHRVLMKLSLQGQLLHAVA